MTKLTMHIEAYGETAVMDAFALALVEVLKNPPAEVSVDKHATKFKLEDAVVSNQ